MSQGKTRFVSKLLMETMGPEVFDKPPDLDRAHRSLFSKPKGAAAPRTIIACFHQYQDKECALRWARQDWPRFVFVQGHMYSEYWALLNIHAPNFDDLSFIQNMFLHIAQASGVLLTGGDFNFCLDTALRFTSGGKLFLTQKDWKRNTVAYLWKR